MTLTIDGTSFEDRVSTLTRNRVKKIQPFETGKRVYYVRRAYLENFVLKGWLDKTGDETLIEKLEQLGHRTRPVWLDLGDEQTMVLVYPPDLGGGDLYNTWLYDLKLMESDWVFEGSTVFDDDFNGGKQETWGEEVGTWAVESDEYSGSTTGFNTIRSSGGSVSWTDYYAEADVKVISGVWAGLCCRLTTSPSLQYYVFYVYPGADEVRFYAFSGSETLIAYAEKISLSTNTWYNLRLECYKNTVKGFLDDREMIKAPRLDWTTGKIQLVARGTNPHAHFDDVLVVED